mmetsp:Transcript_33075/g.33526  ORF Transcript_33075/g.33526 Transcript_33075/m.33526 type:complete len:253 (-) Transcript_33075:343-1101(-)
MKLVSCLGLLVFLASETPSCEAFSNPNNINSNVNKEVAFRQQQQQQQSPHADDHPVTDSVNNDPITISIRKKYDNVNSDERINNKNDNNTPAKTDWDLGFDFNGDSAIIGTVTGPGTDSNTNADPNPNPNTESNTVITAEMIATTTDHDNNNGNGEEDNGSSRNENRKSDGTALTTATTATATTKALEDDYEDGNEDGHEHQTTSTTSKTIAILDSGTRTRGYFIINNSSTSNKLNNGINLENTRNNRSHSR